MASTPISGSHPDDRFDVIVVGAGAAGCVLANRLSADPTRRVALIEAGPSDRPFPVNVKTMLPDARYNWQHRFAGGAGVNERQIPCPRGRLLGGSTSVNGGLYVRGHRRDYDDWQALGNPDWSYDDVLPVFKAQERFMGGAGPFHGDAGELDVQRVAEPNPLARAFVDAAVQAGHTANDDFNGAQQDGFGLFHVNQRAGARLSSSRAFLHPAMARPNLTVMTGALVERVRLHGRRAVGVTLHWQGRRRELDAGSEVVLSAGTVNSPQLPMLSGIGPVEALAPHGIAARHALPGVGQNLQDHPSVPLVCSDPTATTYALSWRTAGRVALAPWRYALARRGMLASNGAEAGGFLRSRPDVDRPDLQLTFIIGMKENARTMPRRHGFDCHVNVQRPASRGTLTLASADPADRPVMRPCFLEDRRDVELLIHGLREADASVMPRIVSGNTAAATMMIGERAAAFVQAR